MTPARRPTVTPDSVRRQATTPVPGQRGLVTPGPARQRAGERAAIPVPEFRGVRVERGVRGEAVVVAPVRGLATAGRGAGIQRVTRSRMVVVGDRNHVKVRYRYRVERVELRAADVIAVRGAVVSWRSTRDLTKPLDRSEFRRFSGHLRARLGARSVRADVPVPRVSRSMDPSRPVEIDRCEGVVIGDENRVTSVQRVRVERIEVGISRGDDAVRAIFDAIRAEKALSEAIARSVDVTLGARSDAERAAHIPDRGDVTVRGDRTDRAGAAVYGLHNHVDARIDDVSLERCVRPEELQVLSARSMKRSDVRQFEKATHRVVERVEAGARQQVSRIAQRAERSARRVTVTSREAEVVRRDGQEEFSRAVSREVERLAHRRGQGRDEVAAAVDPVTTRQRDMLDERIKRATGRWDPFTGRADDYPLSRGSRC